MAPLLDRMPPADGADALASSFLEKAKKRHGGSGNKTDVPDALKQPQPFSQFSNLKIDDNN